MDSVDWKLLLACAHNIISRIWLSHPSASPGVRGSVSSSSCTCHSKTQGIGTNNKDVDCWLGSISVRQFERWTFSWPYLLAHFFLVLPYTSCEDLAAARTMEEETNLVCGPFLSCQIELMIYPLWQQFSCSHIGCPVMQCTCSQFLSSHFQLFRRLPCVCSCNIVK